jgi:hypothetical protein
MFPVAQRPITDIIKRAHARVYNSMSDLEVICEMVHNLGRPTVARFTGTPDLKTVSRWTLSRNAPKDDRLEKIRNAAVAYYSLLELGMTSTNAEQWFRGANPTLGFTMPVDTLRAGNYPAFFSAVESLGHQ